MILSSFAPFLPALTIFMAMAIQETSLPLASWTVLRPDMVIIALFYWRIYRPDLCGPVLAFITGLLLDMISTTPIGLNALSKVILILLASRYGKLFRAMDFLLLLPVIAIFVLIDEVIQFTWVVVNNGLSFRWDILAGRPVATLIVMPLQVRLLIFLHRSLLEVR
ncbi:MAG: rod shape-determining protein MreD [Magnetococcales bacterium]|nr:rod shape-determining protein MreD [Magnetococcales bacterium]